MPDILPDFNQIWIFLTNFCTRPKHVSVSGSHADNTRTDMRQITGAFRYYANAAKWVDGSGSASILWRLKIFDPSTDHYLQTTCMV